MKNQLTALQRATLFAHVKNAAAEHAAASVYLEEFVRREDYLRNRRDRYQQQFLFT